MLNRFLHWLFRWPSPSLGRRFTLREVLTGRAGPSAYDATVSQGLRDAGL